MAFKKSVAQNHKAEGGIFPNWTRKWSVWWKRRLGVIFEDISDVHCLGTQDYVVRVCVCVCVCVCVWVCVSEQLYIISTFHKNHVALAHDTLLVWGPGRGPTLISSSSISPAWPPGNPEEPQCFCLHFSERMALSLTAILSYRWDPVLASIEIPLAFCSSHFPLPSSDQEGAF